MNHKLIFLILFLIPVQGFCQYTGGSNDGFNSLLLSKIFITDADAFKGRSGDGFTVMHLVKTNLTDAAAFKGSSADGFGFVELSKTDITDVLAFRGGIGRGEVFNLFKACSGETIVWNGSEDDKWNNEVNWNCGILPGINSTVFIPFGVPNYPFVNGNYEIKKLILSNNTSIIITTGIQFIINGQ